MDDPKMSNREKKAFQTGLFDDLSVQDSFTIIVLYAAQLDPEDCEEDIDRIMALLNSDALFAGEHLITRDRINKFQNSMEKVNPLNAVEKATKVLTPELRQKAFMIATQIGKAIQEKQSAKILESLATKLSLEKETVEKAIDSTLKKG
jgi:F420-dependent methylenetetrahydromethanopterin dehydrogenase